MVKKTKRNDGRYSATLTIGENPDGSFKRKYFYGKTQKEAEEKKDKYIEQIRTGSPPQDEKITFYTVSQMWLLNKYKENKRQYSYYKSMIQNHLNSLFPFPIREIKAFQLQDILSDLNSNGYAKQTMKMVKITANQIVEFAIQREFILANRIKSVSIPSGSKEERLPLSQEQLTLVLQNWENHRMGIPVLIMLFCGLRRGELVALKWTDINLKTGTISITKAAELKANSTTIKKPKTNAGARIIPIPDFLLSILKKAKKANDYVCASSSGGIMTPCAYKRAWDSYQSFLNLQAGGKNAVGGKRKKIVFQRFTAHQLRHTYATLLYDAGVDMKSAQLFLGHSDLSVTMEIYTHLSNQKKQASIDSLNTHIDDMMKSI